MVIELDQSTFKDKSRPMIIIIVLLVVIELDQSTFKDKVDQHEIITEIIE